MLTLTNTCSVLTSYHNHIQPTKNPSQSPSSSPTEICPGGIVPPKELAEGCVTTLADDLNDCRSVDGAPDEITLSSDGNTKICGKTSEYDTNRVDGGADSDIFVFSLNQGGIRIILNVPGSSFNARLYLTQVSANDVCGAPLGITRIADSNDYSGPDPNTGQDRYVPDKLDGSADYIITASGLPAGTYRLIVRVDVSVAQPGDLSCSATGGGLPYTIEVEEGWAGPTV